MTRFLFCLLCATLLAACGAGQPATPMPTSFTSTPLAPTVTLAPVSPTMTPAPPAATITPVSALGTTPATSAPPTATATRQPAAGAAWTRTYGGNRNTVVGDVLMADDRGYFILGTTNLDFEQQRGSVYLIRTDAAGEIAWEKTYGKEGYHQGLGITRASDGNLLIVGVASSANTRGADAYLLKVKPDGDEIWAKTYGGPLDEFVGAIGRTPDGGYILGGNVVDPNDRVADPGAAGYGGFEGRSNLYLLKVDADGNALWSRAYKSKDNILASGGALTPDGGFLALAAITYFPDPDDDILLMKLDKNGNEVWSRVWKEGKTYPRDLIQTADGHYLITSSHVPPGGSGDRKEDFLFIKIDPKGNEIWRSTFGDPDMIDYGVVLVQAADGGYVAAGERTKDRQTWDADITLVKIDKNGQLVWKQNRTAAHTMISTILEHPDGGFVIAGAMFRGSVFNIILLKTDLEGKMAE